MALPDTRDLTATEGDTWTAATVNACQDAAVDHNEKLRAITQGSRGFRHPIPMHSAFGAGYTWDAFVQFQTAGGSANDLFLAIPTREGERFIGWLVHGRDDGSFSFTGRLYRVNELTGVATQVGATLTSAASGADQSLQSVTENHLTLDDHHYMIRYSSGASGHRVYGAQATWDHPRSR